MWVDAMVDATMVSILIVKSSLFIFDITVKLLKGNPEFDPFRNNDIGFWL
jgi:hypothetical protein